MPHFSGDETVADILAELPISAEILQSHGLSCAGCYASSLESLKDGMLAHGWSAEDCQLVIDDLNEAYEDQGFSAENPAACTPCCQEPRLTARAYQQLQKIQTQEQKLGWGLKIEILPESTPNYFLDLLEHPQPGDRVVEQDALYLFLSPDSYEALRQAEIDYVTTPAAGFKITVPQKD